MVFDFTAGVGASRGWGEGGVRVDRVLSEILEPFLSAKMCVAGSV